MSIVLIQRNANSNAFEKVLGVYSSWRNAWIAFNQRWKKGGFPYSGGLFRYNSIELFDLMISELNPGTTTMLIYSNDNVTVSGIRFDDNGPVKT